MWQVVKKRFVGINLIGIFCRLVSSRAFEALASEAATIGLKMGKEGLGSCEKRVQGPFYRSPPIRSTPDQNNWGC
jgi:hypothetical protein